LKGIDKIKKQILDLNNKIGFIDDNKNYSILITDDKKNGRFHCIKEIQNKFGEQIEKNLNEWRDPESTWIFIDSKIKRENDESTNPG